MLKVNATVRNLESNFSTSAADNAEQKKQKKQKIENEWKTKDGKKKKAPYNSAKFVLSDLQW